MDLAHQDVEWNPVIGLESVLTYSMMASLVMLLVYCWMKQTELQCLLHEIVDSCRALLELIERIDEKYNVNLGQHFPRDNLRVIRSIPDADESKQQRRAGWCSSSVCTELIRTEFMRNSRLGLYYEHRAQSTGAVDAIERLIGDQADDIDQVARLVYELLEKYYLSIRLFLIYSCEQEHILAIWAVYSWPFSFGLTLMCVLYFKRTNSFGLELVVLVLAGLSITNVLMGIPANFNAKVTKLQPLLWSIIGRLTTKSHPRIRHARDLWVKLVVLLHEQKSLIMAPLRIELDYIKIIQVDVWTITLVVLSMR